ncbi:hypothetical protein [Dokdonia sp. R86516]|uniref:hypothetical protein n=1 Tax=Dokdonia sp. R86516 TaxID=3093856 RepID=UPI0037C6832C
MLKEKFLNLIEKFSDNNNYNLECWNEIEKCYSSKSRHYHNLEHLENMISDLEHVESQVNNINALLFSIYYHDIVYKANQSDNEHKSALVFKERISATSFNHIEECVVQIEATKEHQLSSDNDINILLDLDLSILGKSENEYSKYSQNIRKEYKIYPDFMYRKGRKKVLNHMLELDSIFKTSFFKDKYEIQAISNLRSELDILN